MPDYKVIQLKNFKGGLHLARGLTNAYDKTLETLHSDTLKSAIFVCAMQLYGPEKINKSFLEKFRISSAFPFFHSTFAKQTIYFFPKPEMVKLPFDLLNDQTGKNKILKKIRFIEKDLFQQLLEGKAGIELEKKNIFESFVTNKTIDLRGILDKENCTDITKTEPFQHVHIPRDYGSDSVPYYVDKIYFHRNAGLYFLLDATGETKDQVMAAMKLLADNGIGTDRNTGNGQFELGEDKLTLTIPEKEQANYQLNLSLYCPEEQEIKDTVSRSFYSLIKRGGYISSPAKPENQTIRKKSVYMFTEGSLFPYQVERRGKVEDLKPDFAGVGHSIWRDGQPIFLPFNYPNNEP